MGVLLEHGDSTWSTVRFVERMFVNPLYTSTQEKILALFNLGSNCRNGVLWDFNGFIDRLARINTHTNASVGFLSIDAVGDPCSRLSNLFQDTLFFQGHVLRQMLLLPLLQGTDVDELGLESH